MPGSSALLPLWRSWSLPTRRPAAAASGCCCSQPRGMGIGVGVCVCVCVSVCVCVCVCVCVHVSLWPRPRPTPGNMHLSLRQCLESASVSDPVSVSVSVSASVPAPVPASVAFRKETTHSCAWGFFKSLQRQRHQQTIPRILYRQTLTYFELDTNNFIHIFELMDIHRTNIKSHLIIVFMHKLNGHTFCNGGTWNGNEVAKSCSKLESHEFLADSDEPGESSISSVYYNSRSQHDSLPILGIHELENTVFNEASHSFERRVSL